jgi:hypothetical protein
MSAPNISYHRFWNGLVDDAKRLVIRELKDIDISEKAYVDDVKLWRHRVVKELELWNELQDGSRQSEITEAKNALQKLTTEMATLDQKNEALRKSTSVSLLRLRPFRRTMMWDLYSNSLLPRDYIQDRVEKTEASLTSGETAFAAFAAGLADYKHGMVVPDCRENLRGTYFLIDRAIGLRSNVAVPMRKIVSDEAPTEGPILAMVVVSLPFANAFQPRFANRLSQGLRNYEGLIDLMWGYEQLKERDEFEDKPYQKDDIYSIIDDLTPDAENSERESVLPGCAMLVGDAAGGGQRAAAVELNTLYLAVSPRHQSVFVQSELELGVYGVSDRCVAMSDFIEVGGSGKFHIMAQPEQQGALEMLPVDAARVLQEIGNSIDDSFVHGCEASIFHRALETQRGLFGYLLDYVVTGNDVYREKLVDDLRYSRALQNTSFDFGFLYSALDSLRAWTLSQKKNLRYLSICLEKTVPALNYPSGATSYLAGFEIATLSGQSPLLLSEEMPANVHPHLRDAAHELGGPRRFIAWCRALDALFRIIPQNEQVLELKVQDFGLRRRTPPKDLICYLPSMLLPHDAKMEMTRSGERIDVNIQSCSNKCVLKSSWQIRPALLPLATAACATTPTSTNQTGREGGIALTPIKLRGLAAAKGMLFDLRRLHASTRHRNWRFDLKISPSLKPIARLVSALAEQFPEWVASMESLAVVPMPFSDVLEIPTLSQWCQGSGRRHLLIAGILRRSSEQDVWAECDIDLMKGGSEDDPFIERFEQLLAALQRRQGTRRRIEALIQSHFVFTHLSHDICSEENIRTLRRVVDLRTPREEASEAQEKNLLLDSRLIVDDLDQLRLLSREIKSNMMSLSPNLDELNRYVESAAKRAIVHAARKISRRSQTETTPDYLRTLLNIKPGPKVEGRELGLILVLLDNVIRNALEGAWNFNQLPGCNGRGRVCIELRPPDGLLAIRNDAEPGRWQEIQQIYRGESVGDNLGITIIRLVAELLKITCVVQVISETCGEIHLITERRMDADITGG